MIEDCMENDEKEKWHIFLKTHELKVQFELFE